MWVWQNTFCHTHILFSILSLGEILFRTTVYINLHRGLYKPQYETEIKKQTIKLSIQIFPLYLHTEVCTSPVSAMMVCVWKPFVRSKSMSGVGTNPVMNSKRSSFVSFAAASIIISLGCMPCSNIGRTS